VTRILCQAIIVETHRRGIPGITHSAYRVRVIGRTMLGRPLPERVYDVEANDQDQAANGCLAMYKQEFDPIPVVNPRRLVW
jgi:hypothetical protein